MNGHSDTLARAYLDSLAIAWRHINGGVASTEFEFCGKKFATPIMAGGMAHYQKMHPDDIYGFSKAVTDAGAVMWSGYCDDAVVERCVQEGASFVRILKPLADRELLLQWIRHDEQCGATAFAMDVDHSFTKKGELDSFFGHDLKAMQTEDLRQIAASTKLPFLVKGVVSPEDAKACADAGVYGIVLSNHQNLFPWTVPPLMVLPEIKAAVGGRVKIYVDSCLDDGYEVFKALALGADGVCMARSLRKAFMEGGSAAVEEKLRRNTGELAACMAKTACPDLHSIRPDCLRRVGVYGTE